MSKNKSVKYLVGSVVTLLLFTSADAVNAQRPVKISEVQGAGNISPLDGQSVRVNGIVTALVRRAFYIQTPDAEVDNDPKTSEGLLIFGEESARTVAIGDLVEVTGTVTEFRPRGEKIFLSITEITRPTVRVLSKNNPLPAPITLTSAELDPRGKADQMERFEGMRVKGDFVVTAPTQGFVNERTGVATSNGVFYATVATNPRPFREPGMEFLAIFADKHPMTTPAFDMNPENLRIESAGQTGGKNIDVPAGSLLKGLSGVIEYSRKAYTLMVDAANPPVVENIKGFVPVSAAGERELTIGSFNLQNFFDDETNSGNVQNETKYSKEHFENRLKKTSLAVRVGLASPDVLGVVEVENIKALKKLSDRINSDAVAAGQPDPKYVPYLEEGNDIRGIDVGFIVKSQKVKVVETRPIGKNDKLDYPGSNEKLHDRPPFMLRGEVIDPKAAKPLAFTVIVNHFKSYRGIDDEKDGDRVRNKRRLQAESLARFVEERQKVDPLEKILLCGDFNAFQFNDGYNDLIGILKGKSEQAVLVPSTITFATGMVPLIDYIDPRNRYSYTFDGSAQALDHILINRPTRDHLLKFGYARIAADFPVVWANDVTRPERVSDHDVPVIFLSLDEPQPKPSPSPTPAA